MKISLPSLSPRPKKERLLDEEGVAESQQSNTSSKAATKMNKALVKLKTKQQLYLITTDARYHDIDVPHEYKSLSKGLGLSFDEYSSLVLDGGFLRRAPRCSDVTLEVIPDSPFTAPLTQGQIQKLGIKEIVKTIGGKRYYFVYRTLSTKPKPLPEITLAPHELIPPNPTLASDVDETTALDVSVDADAKVDVPTPRDDTPTLSDGPTAVIPEMVIGGRSVTPTGSAAVSSSFEHQDASEVPKTSVNSIGAKKGSGKFLYPRSFDPMDPVAEAWVQHGLGLKFELEDGIRKPRVLVIPHSMGSETFSSSHLGVDKIEMSQARLPSQEMKLIAVFLAVSCCNYRQATQNRKNDITKAVMNIFCYDHGYEKPSGHAALHKWIDDYSDAIGFDTWDLLEDQRRGPRIGKYYERITAQYPNYLWQMYGLAMKGVTPGAPMRVIAEVMNERSKEAHDRSVWEHGQFVRSGVCGPAPPILPVLSLTRDSFRDWFQDIKASLGEPASTVDVD